MGGMWPAGGAHHPCSYSLSTARRLLPRQNLASWPPGPLSQLSSGPGQEKRMHSGEGVQSRAHPSNPPLKQTKDRTTAGLSFYLKHSDTIF